jgi:hypothetical protein
MENSKLDSTNEIKRLLKINHSYFLLFKINEIDLLKLSIENSSGLTLGNIYPHPRRINYFILSIHSTDRNNKKLNFIHLKRNFYIGKFKDISPNLDTNSRMEVDYFEKQYNIKIGRPSN